MLVFLKVGEAVTVGVGGGVINERFRELVTSTRRACRRCQCRHCRDWCRRCILGIGEAIGIVVQVWHRRPGSSCMDSWFPSCRAVRRCRGPAGATLINNAVADVAGTLVIEAVAEGAGAFGRGLSGMDGRLGGGRSRCYWPHSPREDATYGRRCRIAVGVAILVEVIGVAGLHGRLRPVEMLSSQSGPLMVRSRLNRILGDVGGGGGSGICGSDPGEGSP